MKKYIGIILLGFALITFNSCDNEQKEIKSTSNTTKVESKPEIIIPTFIADSAYSFVKAQCDFGPRVPGTEAHAKCADYLVNKLSQYTDHVILQEAKVRAYNEELLDCKNIIASFSPEKKNRVFLAAHWDSRHVADHDANTDLHHKPIIGANDGASGVGVLIEIARLLKIQQPEIGIDIILFDVEDYGEPEFESNNKQDSWALGSQYWANNPHVFNYTANYGILLDMVGASDARFPREAFSRQYAPHILDKVWKKGQQLGYGEYFVNEDGSWINDDHYYINTIAKIPTIDIIHLDTNTENGSFFQHWHTTKDDMDSIDASTLGVVGTTVTYVIFEE